MNWLRRHRGTRNRRLRVSFLLWAWVALLGQNVMGAAPSCAVEPGAMPAMPDMPAMAAMPAMSATTAKAAALTPTGSVGPFGVVPAAGVVGTAGCPHCHPSSHGECCPGVHGCGVQAMPPPTELGLPLRVRVIAGVAARSAPGLWASAILPPLRPPSF